MNLYLKLNDTKIEKYDITINHFIQINCAFYNLLINFHTLAYKWPIYVDLITVFAHSTSYTFILYEEEIIASQVYNFF